MRRKRPRPSSQNLAFLCRLAVLRNRSPVNPDDLILLWAILLTIAAALFFFYEKKCEFRHFMDTKHAGFQTLIPQADYQGGKLAANWNCARRFSEWITEGKNYEHAMGIWKEAMAQLRNLHNTNWNGAQTFFATNALIIGVIGLLSRPVIENTVQGFRFRFLLLLILLLSLLGFWLAFYNFRLLGSHRAHYNQMLGLKTLMELHLGFYNIHLDENQKINLAFPWWVDQLHVNKDTSELRNSPEKWIRGRICGTNSATSKLAAIYCLIFASLLLCHFNYPSSSH